MRNVSAKATIAGRSADDTSAGMTATARRATRNVATAAIADPLASITTMGKGTGESVRSAMNNSATVAVAGRMATASMSMPAETSGSTAQAATNPGSSAESGRMADAMVSVQSAMDSGRTGRAKRGAETGRVRTATAGRPVKVIAASATGANIANIATMSDEDVLRGRKVIAARIAASLRSLGIAASAAVSLPAATRDRVGATARAAAMLLAATTAAKGSVHIRAALRIAGGKADAAAMCPGASRVIAPSRSERGATWQFSAS